MTPSLDTAGKLHKIYPTEQKSDKFTTREFVLEIADGNYPQLIKFQLVQDRCGLLDSHKEGDEVTVHFDLRGREWNGKYLTNLNAWRITGAYDQPERPVPDGPRSEPTPTRIPGYDNTRQEPGDDLPF